MQGIEYASARSHVTLSEASSLKRAAWLWIVAQTCYFAVHGIDDVWRGSRFANRWLNWVWGLKPAISLSAAMEGLRLPAWILRGDARQIAVAVIGLFPPVCWALACWYMTTPAIKAPRTRLAVRVIGIALPAVVGITELGGHWRLSMFSYDWFNRAIQGVDPLLILLIALHLRTATRRADQSALLAPSPLAEKAAYLAGGWLLVWSLRVRPNGMTAATLQAFSHADAIIAALCGVMMVVLMSQLARPPRGQHVEQDAEPQADTTNPPNPEQA